MPVLIRMRLSLAAAAAAIVLASPFARADELAEASKLLKAGQHQQAMERVNKLLSGKPKDPQARFLKGLIYTEQGNTRDALAMFQKLTEDYPELPEPYNNLAVIYASQGQYDKARAALEQSIRTHPSYATAYENLGDVYAKLASQAYDKALKLDSSNAGAQNKLALVRDLTGRLPPAAAPTTVAVAAVSKPTPTPKPAPSAKPAPKAPAVDNGAVLETVQAWAQAWSRKDVDAYLGFYAKDFRTPKGEARADWEKQRRQRILAPKSIAVSIDAPRVSREGDAQAKVSFRQTYKSNTFSASGPKTLSMVRSEDGRWRIRQEQVAN
jgi:Flp pilus assembly protein TadD/ketosteroid isomerase-like protein